MRLGARGRREKVVRPSALGMFLRPVGMAIGVALIAYAIVSLGTTFYRSYYRHLDHTAAVHPDKSVFDVFFGDKTLPPDAVDLVIKDVDGTLRKVVASKSETDKFVNDTILMLEDERARIKQAAHEDLDRSFALAFQDRDQAIQGYADWFFEWKRSYVVLKETISSAIARFFEEPTVAGLAAVLGGEAEPAAEEERMARLLAEVEGMSEEELDALLAAEEQAIASETRDG